MHDWVVGGAIIEGADGVLLVCNRRRGGRVDWTPPGGVIDAGESVIDGLTREVREETGLVVTSWRGPVYEIEVVAPGLGWRLRVEAHVADAFSGELVLADPDGIVVDARFVAAAACAEAMAGGHPWVAEPLVEWLSAPWSGTRRFGYDVAGASLSALEITRR